MKNCMDSDVNTKIVLNIKDNSKMDFWMEKAWNLAMESTVMGAFKMAILYKLYFSNKDQQQVKKDCVSSAE